MLTACPIDLETPVYDPKGHGTRSHLDWSKLIARAVRQDYHFAEGSQEEQDLEQTAALELTRKVEQFDPDRVPAGGNPDMAFRGWVQRSIKTECVRAAIRLRNGGTFHTARRPPAPVGGLPDELPDDTPSAAIEIGDVRCRLAGIELTVESEPDLHTWAVAVGQLDTQRERSLWMLGDLVLYGVQRFADDAWDQLGAMKYASETIRLACRMSLRYPSGIRIPQVTWSHHVVVCRLEISAALAMLRKAAREKLSRRELKALVAPPRTERRAVLSRRQLKRLPEIAQRNGVSVEVVLAVLGELRAAK